ncbi:hypothetical protein AA0121_g13269 [Alternaria tenuissima]|nr:hypothetical protein AA0121_g13269 [Alternaria tenuissima]
MSADCLPTCGTTDTPPSSSNISSTLSLPANFYSIIRQEYPDEKKLLLPGRKRRSKGTVSYVCNLYDFKHDHRQVAVNHVNRCHPLDDSISSTSPVQRQINTIFPPVASTVALRNSFNLQAYREALVHLLTRRRMPLNAVEWSELKDLALACNPAIDDLLITSRRTMVRLLASNYDLYIEQLKGSLSTAVSQVHISTDLWTSPHRHALLAVCTHWVDGDYKLQKALLALPECRFTHSGEQQSNLVLSTLERFNIQSRIGYHTGDNATSNNTCLQALAFQLKDKYAVSFNPVHRRVRCIGHIINLSLQAFLLASSKEALVAALESASEITSDEPLERFSQVLASRRESRDTSLSCAQERSQRGRRRRDSWSSQGSTPDDFGGIWNMPALGKLHGLAVWLHSSSIHSDLWDKAVDIRLGIDNTTRWSSWYQVIHRAIEKQDQIKAFMIDHETQIGNDRLLASDWDLLGKAHAFLQPFASATLYAEGSMSSISQSLLIMDLLLLHYEQQKEYYSADGNNHDPRMLRRIDMG